MLKDHGIKAICTRKIYTEISVFGKKRRLTILITNKFFYLPCNMRFLPGEIRIDRENF